MIFSLFKGNTKPSVRGVNRSDRLRCRTCDDGRSHNTAAIPTISLTNRFSTTILLYYRERDEQRIRSKGSNRPQRRNATRRDKARRDQNRFHGINWTSRTGRDAARRDLNGSDTTRTKIGSETRPLSRRRSLIARPIKLRPF